MKIHYIGHTPAIRTVGDYQWDAANDYTVEVESAAVVSDLLTNVPLGANGERPCDFTVADDDPLKRLGLSDVQIAGLAMAETLTPEKLAKATASKLASASGINAAALEPFIAKATKAVEVAKNKAAEAKDTKDAEITKAVKDA
jgi:hypothetical protein